MDFLLSLSSISKISLIEVDLGTVNPLSTIVDTVLIEETEFLFLIYALASEAAGMFMACRFCGD